MRVALLTYSTKPRGGVVHTLNLAEALAEAGVDVTVWSLSRDGDRGFFRTVDPRVGIRLVDFPEVDDEDVTGRIVRSIALLRANFTPDSYDIVHAQDCISANAVGTCIRTIHHLDTFTTPILAECHEKAIVEPYARICVSEAVAAEVKDGWGYQPTVIPNGVQADRFIAAADLSEQASAARERWRNQLGPYVLTVGGIEPRKGTLDLIDSYHLLRKQFPELALVIAGGETLFDYREYRSEFTRRCEELAVEPVILGAVEDDELPSLVAAADIFAFPSTKEGFGLAAMEALAAERAVVMRDLPVLREVFGDCVDYAADPAGLAAAMAAGLSNPDHRRRSAGQELARSKTWAAAARAHIEFYRAHPA